MPRCVVTLVALGESRPVAHLSLAPQYNAAKPLPLEVTNENDLDEATLKRA